MFPEYLSAFKTLISYTEKEAIQEVTNISLSVTNYTFTEIRALLLKSSEQSRSHGESYENQDFLKKIQILSFVCNLRHTTRDPRYPTAISQTSFPRGKNSTNSTNDYSSEYVIDEPQSKFHRHWPVT